MRKSSRTGDPLSGQQGEVLPYRRDVELETRLAAGEREGEKERKHRRASGGLSDAADAATTE